MLHMLFAGPMAIGALHTARVMEEAEHCILLIMTGETFGIGCLNPPGYQHQHHGKHDAGNNPLIFHFSSIQSWIVEIS